MKKKHRASQQSSSSQQQNKKGGKGGNNNEPKSADKKPTSITLKSKYHKGTITQEEIPELLSTLKSWECDDILLSLSIMRTHLENLEIQQHCLQILSGVNGGDVMSRGTTEIIIGASGGIELVLSAMRTFSSNANIQKYGCYALTRLVIVRENLRKFVRNNGFDILNWQIIHNTSSNTINTLSHIQTLRYAIALLLSNRSTEKSVHQYISSNGIETIINAMRSSLTNEDFLHSCLSLLNTLCTRKADAVTTRLSRVPLALETVTAAMALHPHSRVIQNRASALLRTVLMRSSNNNRICNRFCECDGTATVLAALMHHKDKPDTINAILALAEVAGEQSHIFQDSMVMLKGIDLVVALLGKFGDKNRQVQMSCFRTLTALTRGCFEAQMCVEKLGGIAAALIALKKYENSARKIVIVCEALFAFTWANVSSQKIFCDVKGVDIVTYLLSVHYKASRDVSEAIAKLLVSVLSSDDRVYKEYYTKGVEQTLGNAFVVHSDSFVIKLCIDCLKRINNNNNNNCDDVINVVDSNVDGVDGVGCSATKYKEMELECYSKGDFSYNWCQTCYFPQKLYRCITCDDNSSNSDAKKRSTKVYCKYCWEKYHVGHKGVEMFIVGSCCSSSLSSPPLSPPQQQQPSSTLSSSSSSSSSPQSSSSSSSSSISLTSCNTQEKINGKIENNQNNTC